jgi:ribulose-5-phosphate 4-epimerase/fuculose-1-phosphate aldolase
MGCLPVSDYDPLVAARHHLTEPCAVPRGSGNLSVRVGEASLVAPSGSSCSRVRSEDPAKVSIRAESQYIAQNVAQRHTGRLDRVGPSGPDRNRS